MDKMKLNYVLDFILTTKDNDTLVKINEVVKDRLSTNSSRLKYQLEPGDKVKITGSGKITEGTIHKVNRTRALVITYYNDRKTKFNVPFTMLTKITNKEVSDGKKKSN